MLKCMRQCINHVKTQSTALFSNRNDLLIQQTRNTFILKRRHPVPLCGKNKQPSLKPKHFIYDVVQNTNCMKQPTVDIILLETINRVGEKGQKITAPTITAYERFLLPKLAVYATPENIEKYLIVNEEEKLKSQKYSSRFVERTINILSICYLQIIMSMDVPWTIEKWHIRVNFRRTGYIVPEDAITLPEKTISGPDLSIENKEFYVTVKINNCEEVKVRCKIHHHTSNQLNQIETKIPFWEMPSVAIFPEDQPILDSLPKHRLITT